MVVVVGERVTCGHRLAHQISDTIPTLADGQCALVLGERLAFDGCAECIAGTHHVHVLVVGGCQVALPRGGIGCDGELSKRLCGWRLDQVTVAEACLHREEVIQLGTGRTQVPRYPVPALEEGEFLYLTGSC